MMPAHGAKSAADIAATGNLRSLTLNIDGIDGDLLSILEWLDLNEVDLLCMQESKLHSAARQTVFDAFLRHGFTAFFPDPS